MIWSRILWDASFAALIGDLAAQIGKSEPRKHTARTGQVAGIETGGEVGAYRCGGPLRLPKLHSGFKGIDRETRNRNGLTTYYDVKKKSKEEQKGVPPRRV